MFIGRALLHERWQRYITSTPLLTCPPQHTKLPPPYMPLLINQTMAAATVTVTTYALCLMATQCAQDAMSGLCEKGNDYMSVPLEYSSYSSNKCLNVAGGNHAAGTLLEV